MSESLAKWPKEWTRVPGFENFTDIVYEKKYFHNGGVARLSFCYEVKPGFYAFRTETFDEFGKCFLDASVDRSIGVVVMSSVGNESFLAGGDMNWEAGGGLRSEFEAGPASDLHAYMRDCPKPIIAAIKGFCIAVGNHLSYCADFTIAADNAIFGQNGPRMGSPAQGFLVSYLTRVVGAKKAREMWMLCRRYTAYEALQMGLVNTVVPLEKLDEEVDQWCQEILSKVPECIGLIKRSFDVDKYALQGSSGGLVRLFDGREHFENPNVQEAFRAWFDKRDPDFGGYRGRPEGQ